MIIYLYNKQTFEYLGQVDAQKDILESKKENKEIYMFPPNSTSKKPDLSKTDENNKLFFSIQKNKWEIKEDYRRTKLYNINDKSCKIIDIIGETPDDFPDYTLLVPPGENYIFQNGEWVIDEIKEQEAKDKIYLQQIVTKKLNEIIIDGLIKDNIISNSGEVLEQINESELNKDIFQMIAELDS